ncbi:flagellar basal-body MS-ring/collar protein FliF [Thalassorhabdus alkalitolerans]|uniref:Flagellar M-ring protein n=1 Tax=Thalassorhabdus alkalitolerans TaxID=2282697 RepID=A0ABW0YIH7_9BACI
MNEKFLTYKNKTIEYWQQRTKQQKLAFIGILSFLIILMVLAILFSTRSTYTPLYSNLTVQETGQIKETLDARGISSQVSDDGTTIKVPEELVDTLKVELAAEGIPQSGSIDYSFVEDRMGFGMTDSEFSVMERAAMQTELANLIRGIDGVNQANVMITLPEESTWVSDQPGEASASIVLHTAGGYQPDQQQVRSLYHLVSKSVPSLPVDNIVIMNQMFEHFYYEDHQTDSTLSAFDQQRSIQREIEQDIQRELQQMLGTMMGQDKVLVSVTTDIDFTQENREESLVEPVDEENMEGIAVSVERITETYEGNGAPDGGIVGADEEDIPAFPAEAGAGEGEYERIEDRINNEVNRIHREIVESPYKVRDIGVQVMVEPPDPEDPATLPADRINDIQEILGTIVRTSIDQEYTADLTEADIEDKIFVSSHPFIGKVEMEPEQGAGIPVWLYIAGGVLIAVIILLIILLLRSRRQVIEEEELMETTISSEYEDLPEPEETEEEAKRKQLERMAKERPEEFSKLLRTWLSDD